MSSWPRNAVDSFVLQRMRVAGLSPSPPADAETLVRRLSLDLTGLPPNLNELDAFLADGSPGKTDRLIQQLLARPQFGERMAQFWLDAARYADTHGYLIDPHRDMWRWRDWVILALNDNQPFDQFTIEQLAGDLLPAATLSQRIATGFCRNHMVNYENGAIAEAYRTDYVHDRVTTTATVWLGQTLHCARCHDHKYDPFTMRDYYRLFAFFNNVPEEGLDGNQGNAVPFVQTPTAQQQAQLDAALARIQQLEEKLQLRRTEGDRLVAEWEISARANPPSGVAPSDSAWQIPFDSLRNGAVPVTGKRLPAGTTLPVSDGLVLVPGRIGQALLCNGTTRIACDGLTGVDSPATWSLAIWLYPTTADRMAVVSAASPDGKQHFTLSLDQGQVEAEWRRGAEHERIKLRGVSPLARHRWQHLIVGYGGGNSAESIQIYLDGRRLQLQTLRDRLPRPVNQLSRWQLGAVAESDGFRGLIDEFQFFARELQPGEATVLGSGDPLAELLAIPRALRSADQQAALRDYYLAGFDSDFRQWTLELTRARRAYGEQLRAVPTTMVMRELPEPRETRVLVRGEFDRAGDRVDPDTPAVLPRLLVGEPRNRLGLARWLVHPSNPLTARVTVNRIWQQFFGLGLVRTPEDFGLRGEPPTHPELLDWLAVEFIESGWDIKHLVRLIVESATYQQSSNLLPEHASDPENRWLARAPRLRLDAESLRDSALSVSGLLDARQGGPSVFPYQPPGLWEEVSFHPAEYTAQVYHQSQGRDVYRRSLYTFWKRTLPPPSMILFDAPTRETCTVARPRTNTPLQALVLMNDPTFVEAARALAGQILRQPAAGDAARLSWAFRRVTARLPQPDETAALTELYRRQRVRFDSDPDAATRLVRFGESPVDEELSAIDLAAWTVVANVLLCLDETITRN